MIGQITTTWDCRAILDCDYHYYSADSSCFSYSLHTSIANASAITTDFNDLCGADYGCSRDSSFTASQVISMTFLLPLRCCCLGVGGELL